MPIDVLMPALSPTMEQGKLSKVAQERGRPDQIRKPRCHCRDRDDKATMEVEAVDEGVLAKILVADGTDNVAVNTKIAVIAADGEDAGRCRFLHRRACR